MNVALVPWQQDNRDEDTLKKAFAGSLLKYPTDPIKAAIEVFGAANNYRVVKASQDWVHDPLVLTTQTELIKEFGEDTFLPSKLTLARRIFELGEKTTATVGERLAAFRLYADVRGFIEKQAVVDNRSITVNQNKVMVVRDYGTDEQWELQVKSQQAKLVSEARD